MDYTNRIHRLLSILTMLQSGEAFTPALLAEHFGTSQRTIYRDLDHLKAAGVPLVFDKDAGRYRIYGDFFMPPVQLTVEEALALAALAEHVGGGEQIPFMRPALRAMHKIRSQLPSPVREDVAEQAAAIAIRTAAAMPEDGYKDVYDTVQAAIAERRALQCKYDAATSERDDGASEFTFAPYVLLFAVRAWYAIGRRSDRDDGLRCLKLSRFTKVTPTRERYEIPGDFSLEQYLGNAWRMMPGHDVKVEIWFDAEFAQTVSDTIWHRTQEIEWHPKDDSCTFRCTVAGLDEIAWWVLSMGPHCEVRSPPELAERVRDLARRTAARYGG